jgi:hypothetical protein
MNDIMSIYGGFRIFEKIYGPLSISIEPGKCTSDMKTCEKGFASNLQQLCSKFKDSSFMFAKVIEGITPTLKCPLNIGNYTMKQADVDLKKYSFLPFDGFILNVVMKIVSSDPKKRETKGRIIVACVRFELQVEKVRV